MFRAGPSIPKPWRNNGSSPVTQSSPFLGRILALPPLALSSSSLKAWVGQIPRRRPRARLGTLVPQGCQPSPRSGAGTPGRHISAPTDRNGQDRVFRLSPFHPLLPTQLFTAWLAVDSWGPVGACPAGRLHPRRKPGGAEESSRAPAQPRLPAHSALVCIRVSLVFLCSFYMCCCRSLSLFTPLPSCCPQFPGSRHPSSGQELEKPLSGARPLPHPPSRGVCPALPSVLPSGQADGLAAWQEGELPQTGGGGLSAAGLRTFSSPPRHPQASHSSSRAWSLEPPGRGLFAPSPFPPRGLWF